MPEFRMPALGADMEAGTLVEWLKQPGDHVSRGDIIAVVDTDKGAIEIEVFENGVLERTLVSPGARVPVGTVLAVIDGAGPAHAAEGPAARPAPATASSVPAVPAPAQPLAVAPPGHRVRASPAARRRARELGVDLSMLTGTGPGGAIERDDVERAGGGAPGVEAAVPPAPAADRASSMRRAIGAAMAKSKREIPHYYLSATIDMTAALVWLRTWNDVRPVVERVLPVALLLKAVALSLRDIPELNGYWIDGAFRQGSGIHVGCAVALRGGGLVAPAIRDADTKDVATLMQGLRDLTARVRAGTLRSSELTDATITVTSLGDLGVDSVHGIIYPPQVALVGFGRVATRPWVVSGRVEARDVVTVTLAADHRVSDGLGGGRLLSVIDRRLQEPESL